MQLAPLDKLYFHVFPHDWLMGQCRTSDLHEHRARLSAMKDVYVELDDSEVNRMLRQSRTQMARLGIVNGSRQLEKDLGEFCLDPKRLELMTHQMSLATARVQLPWLLPEHFTRERVGEIYHKIGPTLYSVVDALEAAENVSYHFALHHDEAYSREESAVFS